MSLLHFLSCKLLQYLMVFAAKSGYSKHILHYPINFIITMCFFEHSFDDFFVYFCGDLREFHHLLSFDFPCFDISFISFFQLFYFLTIINFIIFNLFNKYFIFYPKSDKFYFLEILSCLHTTSLIIP